MKLGVLGCADIAYKRFLPAAKKVGDVDIVVIAEEYDPSKLDRFCEDYGLDGYRSFIEVLERDDIDGVYIPQPPALHFSWAKEALKKGKHVLIEKPSTTCCRDTEELVGIAKQNGLALHENYMFQYHSQISAIQEILGSGEIGDVRLYRCSFEFPMREANDFRYNKGLGGGALLDAGGYTVKLASMLLGDDVHVDCAKLNKVPGCEVDMYGSATLADEEGGVCQISFGMDCGYRCSLEIWGNKGSLYTNRVFTAPPDYEPIIFVDGINGKREIKPGCDDHFMHSIERFVLESEDADKRENMYSEMLEQARLIEGIREMNGRR